MYEILEIVYGVVPESKEQYKAIMNHYNDCDEEYHEWPEELGYAPYPDQADLDVGGSGYIGVEIDRKTFNGVWEVHGKSVKEVFESIQPSNKQIKEAKKRCKTIRKEVTGCENFPEPSLIFIYSTS